jgi:hypothetical protein
MGITRIKRMLDGTKEMYRENFLIDVMASRERTSRRWERSLLRAAIQTPAGRSSDRSAPPVLSIG